MSPNAQPTRNRVSATSRTAVYGPVRTVVWEGRSREAPPYPDQSLFSRHRGAGSLPKLARNGPAATAWRRPLLRVQRTCRASRAWSHLGIPQRWYKGAMDSQVRPGDVTGKRTAQEDDSVRDLINTTDSAKRNLGNLQKSSLDLLP